MEIKANVLFDDLKSIESKLFKLKNNDKSDEKYHIAEKLSRVSQQYDKLGGNERIAVLIEDYFHYKETVLENIKIADFEKEDLKKQFQKLEQVEASFINSKNVSVIENKLNQLNELNWRALSNNVSFLIMKYNEFKEFEKEDFVDYNSAKNIMKMGDKSLESENYIEFRRHVYNLSSLIKRYKFNNINNNFNGTGIG
jgi:molecular chaperone DnaK